MRILSRLVALAAFGFAAACADADIMRDSSCHPDNPSWVNGGRVMNSYINGGNFQVTGFRGLNLTEEMSINDIVGVMAASNSNFNWVSNIQSIRLNIFSSEQAFAASPLFGDVYTTTGVSIGNLVGTAPPAWGGVNNFSQTNRWVDLDFNPFTLQPGNYIASVHFTIDSGFLSWTETLHDYGLPGDITAFGIAPGQFTEYSGGAGYTTGDAAVRITATPVPSPASGLLLALAAALGFPRRR